MQGDRPAGSGIVMSDWGETPNSDQLRGQVFHHQPPSWAERFMFCLYDLRWSVLVPLKTFSKQESWETNLKINGCPSCSPLRKLPWIWMWYLRDVGSFTKRIIPKWEVSVYDLSRWKFSHKFYGIPWWPGPKARRLGGAPRLTWLTEIIPRESKKDEKSPWNRPIATTLLLWLTVCHGIDGPWK